MTTTNPLFQAFRAGYVLLFSFFKGHFLG